MPRVKRGSHRRAKRKKLLKRAKGYYEQFLVDRFGFAETQFLRRVSPDLEIPYTFQAGLGIERQLTKSMIATVDYIFTRGAHLWRETNINAPVLPSGFQDFSQYLQSRDFDNRPSASGRPRGR